MASEPLTIPYNFTPRDYQLPLLTAMESRENGGGGFKRAVCVWHRRAGKDKTLINLMVAKMLQRVGTYFYFLPTYQQGKKIIWNGMDKDGFPFLSHIPERIRRRTDGQEMLIELVNGSIFQVIGTDKIDSVVGTNPVGCIYSEYSLQDPNGWYFIKPVLDENGGWAVFNFTPRGQNHAYGLLQFAQSHPDTWFSQVLKVTDTKAIPEDTLLEAKNEYFARTGTDALYSQEYMCSFDAPVVGAYFGKQMMDAIDQGRITSIPYEPLIPVDTYWDLGIDDSTSIWFAQDVGKEIRLIDYLEVSGEGLQHIIKILREKPYTYGTHTAPHDISVREFSTGRSRYETAKSLGITFKIIPQMSLEDGIESARNILPRCWFDSKKCERGLNALKSYHKEFDDKNGTYRSHPVHDWSSHACLDGNTLVETSIGNKKIKDITVGEYVITPSGKRKVVNSGVSSIASELLRIETSSGNKILTTKDHRFFTDRGIVYADTLRYNDVIWSKTNHRQLSLKDLFLGYRKTQDIIDRGRGGLKDFSTMKFGENTAVKFQKVILSTTRTLINSTMTLKTLFVSPSRITTDSISKNNTNRTLTGTKKHEIKTFLNIPGHLKTLKGSKNFFQWLENWLKSGTPLKKVWSGILQIAKDVGWRENGIQRYVCFVTRNIKHHTQPDQSSVEHIVKITTVSVKKRKVYDLTVEKDHCYFANGLLVSNSDSFRYLSLGHREKGMAVPKYDSNKWDLG